MNRISIKAIALRMVLHIVGDIGQPLHNFSLVEGSFADAGGNNVKFEKPVSFVNIDGSTSVANNLHKLWDGSLNVYFQFSYEPERTKKVSIILMSLMPSNVMLNLF